MANNYSENNNIVYVLKPGDHQAGVDGDSVKFGGMSLVPATSHEHRKA